MLWKILDKACDSDCRLCYGSEMQGNNGRQWNRLLRFDSWKRQPHPHIISYEPWRPVFHLHLFLYTDGMLSITNIIIQAPCQESKAEKYLFLLKIISFCRIESNYKHSLSFIIHSWLQSHSPLIPSPPLCLEQKIGSLHSSILTLIFSVLICFPTNLPNK